MADRENFRTDYADGPILPTGELVNKFGRVLNGLKPGLLSSESDYSGLGNHSGKFHRQIVGFARITSVDNTCDYDAFEQETQAPCRADNKYTCVFRAWDSVQFNWLDLETELRLDSSAYWTEFERPGLGPIPTYALHDVVPVIYDPLRNWCVPLHSPAEQLCVGFFQGTTMVDVPKVGGAPYAETVTISLEHYRNNWQRVTPALHLTGLLDLPEQAGGGGATPAQSGSMPTMVPLRHNDMLRLTFGTTKESGDYTVVRAGIRITLAGRIYNSTAICPVPSETPYSGFAAMTSIGAVASSSQRFKDALAFQAAGGTVRCIANGTNTEEWAAKVEFFATITRSPGSSSQSEQSESSRSSASSKSSASSQSASSASSHSHSSLSASSDSSSISSHSHSSLSSQSASSGSSNSSSSRNHLHIPLACCVRFDEDTCELTVMYGELEIPSDLGITWSGCSASYPAPC